MGNEEASKGIRDSLLELAKTPEPDPKGDLLSAFEKISETLKGNAKDRREISKAAAELPEAQELLEAAEDQSKAAHELSEAVGKAKDAVLDPLRNEFDAKFASVAGRVAGSACDAIWTANVIAKFATMAAASAVEATVSEVRAAIASRVASTASKGAAEALAADAKTAAGVAKDAAKEASALAVQAAAGALDMLKKIRDSAPGGVIVEVNRGIKELEAVAAITEATTRTVGGMVLEADGKVAGAEEAARNAAGAAEKAGEVGGAKGEVGETGEGAVEGR